MNGNGKISMCSPNDHIQLMYFVKNNSLEDIPLWWANLFPFNVLFTYLYQNIIRKGKITDEYLLNNILNLNSKVISFWVKPKDFYHLIHLAENLSQKIFHGILFQEIDFFCSDILKCIFKL